MVKHVLEKGTYELVDYEGTSLAEPRNGLYLKKYYAWSSARDDDEQCRDALVALEVNKSRINVQYDKFVHLRKFSEGDLVLLWDQAKEPLRAAKFNPMWHGHYMVKCVLEKAAYELVDYEGTSLAEPRNGLYIKKYYA